MSRASNKYLRVQLDIKNESENILKELDIPFDKDLLSKKPLNMGELSKEEFDQAISDGMKDFENGNVYTPEEVKSRLQRKYGI